MPKGLQSLQCARYTTCFKTILHVVQLSFCVTDSDAWKPGNTAYEAHDANILAQDNLSCMKGVFASLYAAHAELQSTVLEQADIALREVVPV